LNSKETDTVITKVFSGMPARSIKNKFIKKYGGSGSKILSWPFQWLSAEDIYQNSSRKNNTDFYPLLAGQGVRLLKHDQSASNIINEIIQEADNVADIFGQ